MRPLPQRDLGTHEDQVTPLTFEHPGQHRGGETVGSHQMDLQLRVEVVGADLGQLAEVGVAGAGDQDLDVPQCVGGVGHERLHRVRVGDVEVKGDGLATVGADLADQVVELLHPTGAECDGKATLGERDGRGLPMPADAPATMAGLRSGRARSGALRGSLQRAWMVMGRWAKPRTLLECTRTELASSTS